MRLLIYETAWRRVAPKIAERGVSLDVLVMDAAGAVTRDGAPVAAEDARPQIGWANADTFFGPASRAYATALLKSPDLTWVQSGAAGFDNRLFAQIIEKGARLTTSHGQAVGMADYVLWGVLDHFQGGPQRRAAQAAGEWRRMPYRELSDSRWLVIGFGAIGEGVAVRARAFGAHVTGVRRSGGTHPAADRMATPAELPALLPEADVVVLACPLSPETRRMADAAFFAAMKPGAVLVNVGRGGLVDEPALLAALDRGAPEHAVLDVFETEPLPGESAFWAHPRVSLSAHAAGMSSGNAWRNDALFVDNLQRFLAGEPLVNEAAPADVLAAQEAP